jgi:hypothetical protein
VNEVSGVPQITTARYAAVISTIAFLVSCGSLYVSKRSFDLSAAKEQREIQERAPAVDIQIRPLGASAASLVLSIINRGALNITPLSLTVEHSFEAGKLYLSNAQQSLDNLKSSLNLQAMGTIAPKGSGTLKATLAGATDGKSESLTPGIELEFSVLIRFGDQQDTVDEISIVRRILPPLADRLQPTPEMFITAIKEAKKLAKTNGATFSPKSCWDSWLCSRWFFIFSVPGKGALANRKAESTADFSTAVIGRGPDLFRAQPNRRSFVENARGESI